MDNFLVRKSGGFAACAWGLDAFFKSRWIAGVRGQPG